jgi:glucose/arabinose dehydrogenase
MEWRGPVNHKKFYSILCLLMSVTALTPALVYGQEGITTPSGFTVDVFYPGLSNPTSMTWGPDSNLYVALQSGEIIELVIGSDGFPVGSVLVGKTPPDLLGLTFVGTDLFVSYTGSVAKLTLVNGTVGSTDIILNGLPHGRHQNDEISYGKDGFLYMGIGSAGDRTNGEDPRSATIVRFKPDGSKFEIFAKGLRNPYGLAFDKDGNLFATDNGPDSPAAPDELDYVREGGDYGFPNYFGYPPNDTGTIGPVTTLQTHSSSDGFTFYYGATFPAEYVGNAFIAQWGANSGDPSIGKRIARVPLQKTDAGYKGQEIPFATGFDHPIDVMDDHQNGLLVADYGGGTIYRISYASGHNTAMATEQGSQGEMQSLLMEILLLGIIALAVLLFMLRRPSPATQQRTPSRSESGLTINAIRRETS